MASHAGFPRRGALTDWQLYRRLLERVRPYAYLFLFSLVGYAIYSLGVVLLADLMQYLLDALGESGGERGLISALVERLPVAHDAPLETARWVAPVAIVALTLLRALGYFAGSYCMNAVARNLIHGLRCELFDALLVAPGSEFDGHSRGSLVSRITFNVEQVAGAVTRALRTVLRESVVLVSLLAYMLYLNWRLCLVFVLVAPFIALVVRAVGRRFRRYSRRIQSSMGEVTQVAGETVGAYREVRMFGGQERQRRRFRAASEDNRDQGMRLAFAEAVGTPVIQALLALAIAALVWFALAPAMLADLTPGALAAFLVAAVQMGKPVRQLSGVQSVLQRGLAASEDIFTHLDREAEPDTGTLDPGRVRGAVRVRGLSFTYPGAREPALCDVSLDIAAGQTVALVGPSGSGKSTLADLLTRFHAAPPGTIFLDDVPLEDYRLAGLRRQIAVVSQYAPLFSDTVYNNIAYGALGPADENAVYAAARDACALEFIEALPAGFATALGEGGTGLSGGQRQRIALARAILKNAPLLILDEATAALDSELEHRVQRALEAVAAGRTTLVIAHRLSTVERADNIVVLERGRVVAQGRHGDLLRREGLYRQLYQRAFAGG